MEWWVFDGELELIVGFLRKVDFSRFFRVKIFLNKLFSFVFMILEYKE